MADPAENQRFVLKLHYQTRMVHKKLTLPAKTCAACQRPFAWRKKWARDWDAVKFCSDRCRAKGASDGN